MNATPKFEKWGKGFSGCDGGNLQGSVWFCGIEWGTGKDHPLETELNLSVSEPLQIYETADDIFMDRASGRRYPLGVKLTKLIAAMRGRSVSEYRSVAYENPFLFHRRSDYFKMNLYPVAFRNVDAKLWVDQYQRLTGLATRDQYLQWCRKHRFPQMQSWVNRGQPKLVVGIGTTFSDDFFAAFGATGRRNHERVNDANLVWSNTNSGNTRIAVIPFLGYQKGSLNSDRLLQSFAERLAVIRDLH
jgi:hypothetical protein